MKVTVEKQATNPCHDHDWVWDWADRRICRRCGRVEKVTHERPRDTAAFDKLYERFHGSE